MPTFWPAAEELEVASAHQREKYALATTGPVGILGGNPGVGKSHIVAQIIKAIMANHGRGKIAVCAFTGKASQRVNEFLIEYGIHDIEAKTIHRTLGVSRNGHDQKGWGFIHNETNPLPYRFVIVDEASMLSIGLLASLLRAMQPGTHLLLVGDFAQLPPVEHGAPLRDMIAAGLPYGELTEPRRNEGDIVRACRDIKEGRQMQPSRQPNIAEGYNLPHVEAPRPALVLAALSTLIKNCPAQFDPMRDTQVLCAIKRQGSSELTGPILNNMLQQILNPDGEQVEGCPFRLGDKIMCTSNGMLPLAQCPSCNYGRNLRWLKNGYSCEDCGYVWQLSMAATDFVANGEIGRVTFITERMIEVSFDTPARTVTVTSNSMQNFELAYAITTHKSQGSQAPVVFVIADDSKGADFTCSLEWWRTAVSRAQVICFTIGKLTTIHRHCKKSSLAMRKTFLVELLEAK